jgi:tetratricopeptide (TPR) repeat protein
MAHLRPTDRVETVQLTVGLYFAAAPPSRVPAMIRLNCQTIDIPAGDRAYTVTDSYVLPADVDAYTIQPHAHLLAKQMKGIAELPDGTTRWLIYIREWDFHWQDAYRYVAPVALPAGTRLRMEYTYDNSDGNPLNPNHPPKPISYGQRTSDEMGELWIQVIPRRRADLGVLTRTLAAKLLPQNISGYEMMIRTDPDNPALHDDLALLYAQAGDLQKTADHFGESLRLRPRAPAAHYNVGNALIPLRRLEEAERQFRIAVELDPEYAPGHFGLGLVLQAQDRLDEAIASYTRALRLRPDWPEAGARLAKALSLSRARTRR